MAQRVGRGQTIRLDAVFRDSTGSLVTPTNPRVDVSTPNDTELVTDAVPTEQIEGHWFYDFAVPIDAPLGSWTVHWTGTINGSPTEDDDHFEVSEGGSITFPPTTHSGGPCDLWATEDDVRSCPPYDDEATYTPAQVTMALTAASEVLYALGGHRWPGLCSETVVPQGACRSGCWPFPMPYGGNVYLHGGACHSDGCCGGAPWLNLNQQIIEIVEVRENGTLLDSDAYVVVDGTHLARTDGGQWPCCIDPADPVPALTIQYLYGGDPPRMGVLAATALARELLLASCGPDGECRLDRRVRSITREGVSMDYAIPGLSESLATGHTGIPEIDLFVHAYNPNLLMRRPRFVGLTH